MGQQQLLLLVLSALIVGAAVVVGINMFSQNAAQANQDAEEDASHAAADETAPNSRLVRPELARGHSRARNTPYRADDWDERQTDEPENEEHGRAWRAEPQKCHHQTGCRGDDERTRRTERTAQKTGKEPVHRNDLPSLRIGLLTQ